VRPLTASELLHFWEEGCECPPAERALLLLGRACPEDDPEALAALPIGRLDARLLTLREWIFGPDLTGMTSCPECGERLELDFTVADVRAGPPPPAADELDVVSSGYHVTFRLPVSMDLQEMRGLDAGAARARLMDACLLGARRDGAACSLDALPDPVLAAVVRRMDELDPQADVHTAVICPACGHGWPATFDIASFFWMEIEAWARRILLDVHTLATAYSWSEVEILALSPRRRQLYLEMVRA
jgi:hypothetical protein